VLLEQVMRFRRIQIRFAFALLALCVGGLSAGAPANAAPPFSLKQLHLGTSAGPEDYLFTRGNSVTGTGRVDASTYYRFVVTDPSATTRSTSLCRPASLGGSVSGSYALGAADPLSGSNAWKFTLQEFTNSLCSGSPSKSAALYFDVARASTFADSGLTQPKSTFGSAATGYLTVAGIGRVKSSISNSAQTDVSVTWLAPSGATVCANTAGTDRPDSTASGALPSTGGSFLQYRPNTTNTGAAWNIEANYNGACVPFSPSNEGAWSVRLQIDATHFVTLPAFSVDATPPDTSLSGGPVAPTAATSASFGLASTESGSSFECRLDGGAWGACTSAKSYSGLASGSHTFDARAIDQAGNVDPTPATRTWTINTALPAVTLSVPADGTATNDVTPTFSGGAGTAPGDSSTVTVEVYGGTDTSGVPLETLNPSASGSSWSVDASPALPEGTYTVLAQQTGVAGTGSSATAVFHVDTRAPTVSLRDPADASATNDQVPAFDGTAGTASGDGGTVTVNLYSGTDTSGVPLETLAADGSSGAWSVDATSALAEGTYTVQAQQSDTAGNTGTSSPHTFRVDLTPPDTTITSAPSSPTGTQEASFRFVSSEAASSFECRLDGGPWGACSSPKTYTALAGGSHTFDVRAIDSAGNADPTPDTHTWTIDTTLPPITLDTPEDSALTNDTTPTFSGVASLASGASSTVNIYVYRQIPGSPDQLAETLAATRAASDGSYSVSASPALTEGTYVAHAEQSVSGGTATSAQHVFTVDTTAPQTTLLGGPAGSTSATTASFKFGSTEPGSSFECRLDGAAWSACASPQQYSALAPGSHTFDVRATDAAGNTDASPATRTWTVDTTVPAVTLTSPADGTVTGDANPTFSGGAGTAPGDLATVTVKVYAGTDTSGSPLETMSTPASGHSWTVDASPALAEGTYTAYAEQSDGASNVGTSAPVTFQVDLTPPHTSIDQGPSGVTASTSANIRFSSNEQGSTFECRLDGAAWSACSSPHSYTGLSSDFHTVDVRAVDLAGNVDPTPATLTWLVDTTAPAVTLSSPADGSWTNDPTPMFSGVGSTNAGDSATITVEVHRVAADSSDELVETLTATRSAIDGSWSTAASPALPDGDYTAFASQDDSAANTATSGTVSFSVDTAPPDLHISGPAAGTRTSDSTPTFRGLAGTAEGDDSHVAVKVYRGTTATGPPVETLDAPVSGATWSVDASPSLADGTYAVDAQQSDAAGNSRATSVRTFTVDTTAPLTTIDSGPSGSTSDTAAAFAFHSSEAGASFECRLDGAAWAACSSPKAYNGVTPGAHAFQVRATDAVGNVEASPAARSWTVAAGGVSGSGPSTGGLQPALKLRLASVRRQKLWKKGIVIVNATCSDICTLRLSGKLQTAARGAKVRTQKITSLIARLARGRKTQLKVKLGKAKRALLKTLAHRGKAKLLLKGSASAPATTRASAKLWVKLKR
jgi:large repetitive protein